MVFILDMVAHFIVYGENQAFRFFEGIWLQRKSRQIRFFFSEKTYFTSYVRNMFRAIPSPISAMVRNCGTTYKHDKHETCVTASVTRCVAIPNSQDCRGIY